MVGSLVVGRKVGDREGVLVGLFVISSEGIVVGGIGISSIGEFVGSITTGGSDLGAKLAGEEVGDGVSDNTGAEVDGAGRRAGETGENTGAVDTGIGLTDKGARGALGGIASIATVVFTHARIHKPTSPSDMLPFIILKHVVVIFLLLSLTCETLDHTDASMNRIQFLLSMHSLDSKLCVSSSTQDFVLLTIANRQLPFDAVQLNRNNTFKKVMQTFLARQLALKNSMYPTTRLDIRTSR